MVKAGGSKQKKQKQKQEQEQEKEKEEGGGGGLMRRKGPWTEQEDVQLVWFVRLLGQRRWDLLAKVSGLQRSGKSCRLRWVNYLQPGLKRGRMSPEEERLVVQLQAKWGNCWSRIAKAMPGRTDNHIKNYWRTHLRNATKPQRHCSSKHQHQASSSDDTRHGHLQLSCELELELDDDQAATPASHQELELCMDDQDQQQLLRYMPLWNDDMIDVHCWSNSCSNAIVDDVAPAPMPMPASPLWDDDDVAYYCGSDYSLW